MEKETKESKFKINVKATAVVGLGLAGVYLLGVAKGSRMGRSKGFVQGYAQAAHELANMAYKNIKSK